MSHSYISNNGMYLKVRRVYCDKALSRIPYGQCGVRFDGSRTVLVSYLTDVAYIDGNVLHVNGLYSRTTIKHISAFLKEYAPHVSYYTVRDAVRDGANIDVQTGERIPA